MKHILQADKRGISVILSYVLLIVIVLALSALVYNFVITKIPKDEEKCPADLSLIIRDYNCSYPYLELELQNKGLFDINGYIIRGSSEEGRIIIPLEESGTIGFVSPGEVKFNPENKLEPGETISQKYDYSKYKQIIEIEIQPFIIKGRKQILCEEKVIREKVNCNQQI